MKALRLVLLVALLTLLGGTVALALPGTNGRALADGTTSASGQDYSVDEPVDDDTPVVAPQPDRIVHGKKKRADHLRGGTGNDRLFGEGGNDVLEAASATTSSTAAPAATASRAARASTDSSAATATTR
jgi:hypothetical protein